MWSLELKDFKACQVTARLRVMHVHEHTSNLLQRKIRSNKFRDREPMLQRVLMCILTWIAGTHSLTTCTHSLTHSYMHTLTNYIHPLTTFTPALIHALTHYMHPLTHTCTHSLHARTHSLTHSYMRTHTHYMHSLTACTHFLTHSLTHSLTLNHTHGSVFESDRVSSLAPALARGWQVRQKVCVWVRVCRGVSG